MRLYADRPALRGRQLLADLGFLVVLLLAAWSAQVVHDGIEALTEPGERVSSGATGLSSSLRDAGGALGRTPLVGDEVSAPFDRAAEASDAMASAGDTSVRAVERLARWAGWVVFLVPAVLVGRRWLPWRWGFLREAGAADRLLSDAERPDLELFAWRAVAHQPLRRLARVAPDPAAAIRRGDREVVARLARLELEGLGLAVPAGRDLGEPTR